MADEKQIRTNIDPELHEEMTTATQRLNLTQKEFLKQAIEAKLGKFDVDHKYKTLQAENATLSLEKEQFRKERDEARRQRDHFKAKHEDAQEAIEKLESDLKAHRNRGLLDRVFNCEPN